MCELDDDATVLVTVADLKRDKAEYMRVCADLQTAQARVAVLEGALRHYADANNWVEGYYLPMRSPRATARAALRGDTGALATASDERAPTLAEEVVRAAVEWVDSYLDDGSFSGHERNTGRMLDAVDALLAKHPEWGESGGSE